MQRYWVSWYSGNWGDEGCTTPPFSFWVSGSRDRADTEKTGRDEQAMIALIESDSEQAIVDLIVKHFPDYKPRFIEAVEADWLPNDRFPDPKVYRIETPETVGAT